MSTATIKILVGDSRETLKTLPDASVHCCVTSPPYWNLRDYGTASWKGGNPECDHLGEPHRLKSSINKNCGTGKDVKKSTQREFFRDMCKKCGAIRVDLQIGLEPTPEEYVQNLVTVFREVYRVLRDDGTCWVNLGDTYAGSGRGGNPEESAHKKHKSNAGSLQVPRIGNTAREAARTMRSGADRNFGFRNKELIGIPWMVAFALRSAGWILRQDIIWSKPNPMPASVRDRCTTAHEYLFLLVKSPRYFWNQSAMQEPAAYAGKMRGGSTRRYEQNSAGMDCKVYDTRNKRSVWSVGVQPFKGAHFATFPPNLIEPCVLAGTAPMCCGKCGSPFKPIVERIDTGRKQKPGSNWKTGKGSHGNFHSDGRETNAADQPVMASVVTGWNAACSCFSGAGERLRNAEMCTVLDPFGGAGTTAVVAHNHGRNAILCELSEEYAAIARKRLAEKPVPVCAEVPE